MKKNTGGVDFILFGGVVEHNEKHVIISTLRVSINCVYLVLTFHWAGIIEDFDI